MKTAEEWNKNLVNTKEEACNLIREIQNEAYNQAIDQTLKLMYDHEEEIYIGVFEDIEKLKYLNRSLSRKRDCEGFTTEIYIQFIERFYNDTKFNELYNKWIETNDKWIKPSLDHIEAKCNGGSLLLNNLQFISWLENRAKMDVDQELWNKMKQNINYYL